MKFAASSTTATAGLLFKVASGPPAATQKVSDGGPPRLTDSQLLDANHCRPFDQAGLISAQPPWLTARSLGAA